MRKDFGGDVNDSIECPSCKRRTITRRDMLYARVDGTVTCRTCGRTARLDMFSRWAVSCVIALVLPSVLLYGDFFYSGHLFLVSIFFIFGAWRILTVIAGPFLALEVVAAPVVIDRRRTIFIVAVLLVAAMSVDGLMSSRFERPDGYVDAAVDNLKR